MKRTSRTNSGHRDLFALFLLVARFVNDRVTRRRFRMEPFGTPWRFSARLARTGGGANLRQNRGHHPTDLPWSHWTAFGLPGQQGLRSLGARQVQLGEGQRDDPTPEQKLGWGAHMDRRPEQILLPKAEAMLFRETQPLAFRDLLQRHQIIQGEKPTHPGITLGPASRLALDSDHREFQLAILLEMHRVPATDPRRSARLIHPLPHGSRATNENDHPILTGLSANGRFETCT
jgi:hypothetical protein